MCVRLVWFLCLMAYQSSWVMLCQNHPSRRTVLYSHNQNDVNQNRADTKTQAETGGLCCSGTNGLSISDIGSSTRQERYNSYNANYPQRAAHLVMFKISIYLRRSRPEILNRRRNGRKRNCLPPWSNLNSNWRFSKSSNSQDHLLTSSMGTRGERHNSYHVNHPQHAAHLVMFKISVGRDLKKQTTSSTAQIQLSTYSFSKSLNSQDHLFRAWRYPHSSPWFIMTIVIVISFMRLRKTVPNDYAPELLTQIVQSPTKLNDEIELTIND